MKRPWQVWLVFALCVFGAAAAIVWLTRQALVADELRRVAEAETELEQRVSLALWRMDTELAPIIAGEVVRPASAFRAIGMPVSPPPYVLLQFEANEDGAWQSPQETAGKGGETSPRLAELRTAVDLPTLVAELPDTPLPTTFDAIGQVAENSAPQQQRGDQQSSSNAFYADNTANVSPFDETEQQQAEAPNAPYAPTSKVSKAADFVQRGQRYQSLAQQNIMNRELQQEAGDVAVEPVGVSRPVWIGDRLILARRVGANGSAVVQGSWLDWPKLKERLLDEAAVLVPGADLVRAEDVASDDPGRILAGLPVRLVVPAATPIGGASSTLRWALLIGWSAVALAVLAAAALLHGVMTLSERRAAFVSSVTHELRTPLTTFRMYADMLARGMVPDAARRQEYFETLQRESERLSLLVENVLTYARLERGRKPQAQDRVTLKSLLERVGPRLENRAAQAEMKCDLQVEASEADQAFTTDQAVVEQILFNLVDNAAKYAREAPDRQIHVEATRNGEWVRFVVRDHGPGIEKLSFGRASRAFGKTAEQSAETASGVGLGLALCRRLSRQLGGRLEIGGANDGGAAVELLLPAKV